MKHILLVEDEAGVARFVQKGLIAEGHSVTVASTGLEGLELVEAKRPDLLIVDIMLPGLNGLELIERARRILPDIAILVLSARDALEDKLAGFARGADDYLAKPFAFDELLARVTALGRRAAKEIETVTLRYHEIEMNLLQRVVTLDGKPIELSRREFDLLEYFLRNPETVLSRTRIAEVVWRDNFDRDTNLVEVYVMYLRKKLELGSERWLQTVRGVGYQLRKGGRR